MKKIIMLGTIAAVTFFSVHNLSKVIHSNVLYSSLKEDVFCYKKAKSKLTDIVLFWGFVSQAKRSILHSKGKQKLSIRLGNINSFIKTRLRSGIVLSSSFLPARYSRN